MISSEYGWTDNWIIEHHTIEQLQSLADIIVRRKQRELAINSQTFQLSLGALFDEQAGQEYNEMMSKLLGEKEEEKQSSNEDYEGNKRILKSYGFEVK